MSKTTAYETFIDEEPRTCTQVGHVTVHLCKLTNALNYKYDLRTAVDKTPFIFSICVQVPIHCTVGNIDNFWHITKFTFYTNFGHKKN